MTKNFYAQKIKEIKKYIQNNEHNKAHKMILEEINMPYIPLKYEKSFQILKEKSDFYLDKKSASQSININKIFKMLNGNENEQLIALRNISKYNLKNHKNYLKKIIENWKDNFKKAILYEILVDQKIDININVDGKIINPNSFSILNNKETHIAYQELEYLVFKNPHLLNISLCELQRYILINFPKVISKDNGKILAKMIFNIVLSMFNHKKKLSKNEKILKENLSQKDKVV